MDALNSARGLGTVLAVWAHPDDESFVAGGLLATASDEGSAVVCLTATRGELGTADEGRWPPSRLTTTRSHELRAAHAVLGVTEHRWLDHEDGGCDRVSPGRGMAEVARVIREVRPDTIVTFGPDGVTGHPDHRAVSRWTSSAWAATGGRARLLWATVTAAAAERMAAVEPVAAAFYPGYPQPVARSDVAIHLDLEGEVLDRKVTAMRAHASQSAATASALGEDAFRQWWSAESYIDVAAPRRRPSTPAPHLASRSWTSSSTRPTSECSAASSRRSARSRPATR